MRIPNPAEIGFGIMLGMMYVRAFVSHYWLLGLYSAALIGVGYGIGTILR